MIIQPDIKDISVMTMLESIVRTAAETADKDFFIRRSTSIFDDIRLVTAAGYMVFLRRCESRSDTICLLSPWKLYIQQPQGQRIAYVSDSSLLVLGCDEELYCTRTSLLVPPRYKLVRHVPPGLRHLTHT